MSKRTSFLGLVSIGLVAFASACVPAPKKAYSPDEAQKLDDLDEIMHVNAATMDKQFSHEDGSGIDDATFAELKDAAAMMKATSGALKEKIAPARPEGFAKYAETLGAGADKLAAAAEAKDAKAAGAAIAEIHGACKGCHSDFR
jgi:cytochrome c556